MNNEKNSDEQPCVVKKPFARENYYFGKLLTAEALKSEQNYFNEKRWIINRYGIGWGVLCGLRVIPDCNDPCKAIVEPGIAIDKNGNEIVVCEAYSVDLKGACQEKKGQPEGDSQNTGKKIYITIRYKECKTNPSPVPVDDCCSLDEKYNYNRSKETFHIDISCTEPEKPKTIREECAEVLGCESDCFNFLDNPAPVIISKCAPREKWCEMTLACICYSEGKEIQKHQIDNSSYRKLAFSNEMLYAMIRCLTDEVRQAKASRYDRRQHIPLLANTIKGLSYQDGKITTIDQNVGIYPFRITSDGDFIWVTDRENPNLIRVGRKTNEVIKPVLNLNKCDNSIESSWGIAFDGKYMWVSHNNESAGKLSRINSCDSDDSVTFCEFPACEKLNECDCYCDGQNGEDLKTLPAYPQELVYHQGLLYVSHGWKANPETVKKETDVTQSFVISVIDTQQCCLLKTITIELPKHCIPLSPISSMVSDGERLWISYTANFENYNKQSPVVQSIQLNLETLNCEIGNPCGIGKGTRANKLAFDGTHLWLTHDDGATKIVLDSGKDVSHTETKQQQLAIAYGGGQNIWTAEYNTNGSESGEARLNRTDIHSGKYGGEIEYYNYSAKKKAEYSITDAQFDGVFIYISAVYKDDNTPTKGLLHRILP